MKEKTSSTMDSRECRTDITVAVPVGLSAAELQTRHQRYLQAATSENTRKTYRSAIRHFERWGGCLPTDKDVVIRYLLEHAEHLNSRTLDVRLTALSQWHQYQGFNDPCLSADVRKILKGIRHTHGRPKQKAKALRLEHLAAMLSWINSQPDSNKKRRDLALIQIGFYGAFRRSELVGIEVKDLVWEPEGLLVMLTHSKTDQKRDGITRAIPKGKGSACPVTALKNWIDRSGINSGPVFRPVNRWDHIKNKALNAHAINDLLKILGTACDFDFVPDLSSHSFRRGLSTSAAREQIDFELIKKQGGWKSDATVREYIEEGQQLSNNAALTLMDKMSDILESQKSECND